MKPNSLLLCGTENTQALNQMVQYVAVKSESYHGWDIVHVKEYGHREVLPVRF